MMAKSQKELKLGIYLGLAAVDHNSEHNTGDSDNIQRKPKH